MGAMKKVAKTEVPNYVQFLLNEIPAIPAGVNKVTESFVFSLDESEPWDAKIIETLATKDAFIATLESVINDKSIADDSELKVNARQSLPRKMLEREQIMNDAFGDVGKYGQYLAGSFLDQMNQAVATINQDHKDAMSGNWLSLSCETVKDASDGRVIERVAKITRHKVQPKKQRGVKETYASREKARETRDAAEQEAWLALLAKQTAPSQPDSESDTDANN